MSVKSYFESERRKKQITWMLIILGGLFAGAMLSSYYSHDKSRLLLLRLQAPLKSRWFLLKLTMNNIRPSITIDF